MSPGAVEEADRNRRQEQERDDRRGVVAALERRPQSASDEHEPQEQSDEQEDLPEAADVDVFPALVAEPEVVGEPELLHDREPLARERADDDDDQADPQHVDAQTLEPRLVPRDRRTDVKARAEPGGRDPEHGELRVPAARQAVRQHVGEREAVRGLAFDLVMRGRRPEQDLDEEERHDEPEVLRGRAHRRRDRQARERIARRRDDRGLAPVPDRVMPGEEPDARDHEQDAEHRPQERPRRRDVAASGS
jgi:hypothetical protein